MTAPNTESAAVRPARRGQAPVVVAVSLGGGTGAAARYAASLWWPTQTGGFPWTTFWVNVAGCALIGVLMAVVTEVRDAHRLVRPLPGHRSPRRLTTFSTYAVDLRQLFAADQVRTGSSTSPPPRSRRSRRCGSPPGRPAARRRPEEAGDTDAKGEGSS